MDQYRSLTDRLKKVKSNPESRHPRNVAQVNKTDRDLRKAIQRFQELEAGSRQEMQGRMERQARIVHPDASDAEIAQIVNSDTQIFQQAVMGSRAEQANRVLGAVKQRHQEMLQIERSLMELLDLLNDMQELLTKQEVAVMAIDTNAEQAAGDMVKANEELEVAVTTARKTRKKKWICLGICGMLLQKGRSSDPVPILTSGPSSHRRYHRGCGRRVHHGQQGCQRRRQQQQQFWRPDEAQHFPTGCSGRPPNEHGPRHRSIP
jgi:syntaxin 1B/2/3